MVNHTVSMELLNPRGEIEVPPVFTPSMRISDLAGKTIGLYSNGKPGMDNFYTAIEELLRERYPDSTVTRMTGAFEIRDDDARNFASGIDAFIYAVGD
jgi:hypothetical protein